jgi:hypothetical protein
MKGKQVLYLFLALLLPGCVFIFLKIFGENEFNVPPLYHEVPPVSVRGCEPVTAPYHLPDTIMGKLGFKDDSLVVAAFTAPGEKEEDPLTRIITNFAGDPVHITYFNTGTSADSTIRSCIFFLNEPFDVVLVDREGQIRGEYDADDRDEIDRLITEITIILKKY